jgi:hypothetical protein
MAYLSDLVELISLFEMDKCQMYYSDILLLFISEGTTQQSRLQFNLLQLGMPLTVSV